MARLSRAEARAFVDEISIENGGITNEDRAQTPARVLKTLRCVTSQLGGAITTYCCTIKNMMQTPMLIQSQSRQKPLYDGCQSLL